MPDAGFDEIGFTKTDRLRKLIVVLNLPVGLVLCCYFTILFVPMPLKLFSFNICRECPSGAVLSERKVIYKGREDLRPSDLA